MIVGLRFDICGNWDEIQVLINLGERYTLNSGNEGNKEIKISR